MTRWLLLLLLIPAASATPDLLPGLFPEAEAPIEDVAHAPEAEIVPQAAPLQTPTTPISWAGLIGIVVAALGAAFVAWK